MKKTFITFVSCLAALPLLLCGCSSSPEVDPLNDYERVIMHASWDRAYSGIEDLIQYSDIVAQVKITGIKGLEHPLSNAIVTIYNAEVVTPICGTDEKEIEILMLGGIDYENKIIHESASNPLMNVDDEFVVFLHKNKNGMYSTLGGPQGRFVVDNECVYSLSEYNSVYSEEGINVLSAGGKNLNDFIEEVRSYII